VRVTARGRDLHTDAAGGARVLSDARVSLELDFSDGVITEIEAEPGAPDVGPLVGRTTHRGFRAALDELLPAERDSGSVRAQLLDDLPMTVLLSGRVLRAAGIGIKRRDPNRLPVDICAGWAAGGTLLAGYTEFGPPFRIGPIADDVTAGDDPVAWHEHRPLPAHATRSSPSHRRVDRRRRPGSGRLLLPRQLRRRRRHRDCGARVHRACVDRSLHAAGRRLRGDRG
jgi:hypothetical protein